MRRLLPDHHGGKVRATDHLVAPLAQRDWVTEMCGMEIAGCGLDGSSTVAPLIGLHLRRDDVDSATLHSTPVTATTPGTRTSTTATRTTGTRTTSSGLVPSADDGASCLPDLSFEELVRAYFACRRRKRNTRSALAFEVNLEANLWALFEDVRSGAYRPGMSLCFVITRPKPREVWAANFRDRIVQHLLYNRLAPRFLPTFIADSCACIPGRGTLYGAQRLESKVRSITRNWTRDAYYLKIDVSSCFPSVDKNILWALMEPKIPEPFWRDLARVVLFHDPRTNYRLHGSPERLRLIPPHKSLFGRPAWLGLPIGNLDSQFGLNIYLNVVDQYAKHQLKARYYSRYVDDIVVLHESATWLNMARERIESVMAERLALKLNPDKTIIQPLPRGVDFVGQVIRPHCRTTRRRTVNAAMKRLKTVNAADLRTTANSYFGTLRQATHSWGDRARMARLLMERGRCVDLALTKTYRTAQEVR